MKKNIYVSIICFFLLVMMFSGVMIYRHFKEAHTQEEIYDSLVEIVEENETSETVEATQGEAVMLPEYAKLYEQNSDIVGWIRIDDTQINYPVMQSPQEPNFYLKHGFDKEYTDYGCPYMSESCDVNKPYLSFFALFIGMPICVLAAVFFFTVIITVPIALIFGWL